jgi:hypothetical protein
MACREVFDRIRIIHWVKQEPTIICWKLKANFNEPGPYHFYVDVARSGSDEWTPISEVPVVDHHIAYDFEQRVWAKVLDQYYRVRLILPTGEVITSEPQHALDNWPTKQHWIYAREIARKEYLAMKRFTGTCGTLLKRKVWGPFCERKGCRDYDTEEVTFGKCPSCWGTGLAGGYYPGIEFWLIQTPGPRRTITDDNVGLVNKRIMQARCLSYPFLETNDVWVDDNNDKRYIIQQIQPASSLMGIPIIQNVELRLAPFTDIVYSIPKDGTIPSLAPEDTSSESSEVTPDYRKAVSEYAW